MSKKKPARVSPLTADRLLRGWTGPGDTRIRVLDRVPAPVVGSGRRRMLVPTAGGPPVVSAASRRVRGNPGCPSNRPLLRWRPPGWREQD
ncbi:hypothetical protein ACH4OY_31520 [Micromonospora rubida]|uniref:Uncharacterized protein n=1 Tax=Micromonospora rubida TaxID=2697657 RepID=A0ABW7SW68_9ACTN